MLAYLKAHRKALASGAVTLAAYLMGVIPAEGSFDDVSTVQWLGAVVAVGTSFGIVAGVRNGDVVARLDSNGNVRAGEAALQRTDAFLGDTTPVGDLVPSAPPPADAG